MKKKAIILLAGVLLLSFMAACGGGSSKQETKSVKEHVYSGEEVRLDEIEDKSTVNTMILKNDRMYIVCSLWNESGSKMQFISRNPDGSDSSQAELAMKQNETMSNVTVDEGGNYIAVVNEYFEDNSNPENYVFENNYYLVKMDSQAKELWRQELTNDIPDTDYYGVTWMNTLKDGKIALIDSNGITMYDTDGKQQSKVKLQREMTIEGVFQLQDGSIVVNSYNPEKNEYLLSKLNIETGELTEDYSVPGNGSSFSYYAGVDYDLILMGNSNVYGYNLGDEQITQLMNLVDSDMNTTYIYNIVPISKTEFYGMYNDNMTNELVMMKFSKVDPADVVEKTIMTLGCYGVDWDIRNQVVAFNKSNKEYRIQIKDYSEYNTDDDYEAGISKLNTDIASGNVPDILVMQNNMPVSSYVTKGLFEDLYPYIDKDEELDRSTYFQNVLKAFEVNGKLYQMIPSFSILTVAGKTSEVGNKAGWILAELNKVMDAKPKDTTVFADMVRNDAMSYCIQMSGNQFIDWESGECKFNSDGFIQLLDFIKKFPDKIAEPSADDSLLRNYETQWREGKVLLSMTYLNGFDDYNDTKKRIFGEDITLIGFPSENRKGSVISPNMNIVMSSKSTNKDGAWQFMRYFLTDQYQNKLGYGWPLSTTGIEAKAEKARQKPTYEDEKGNIVEYEPTYNLGGVDVVITPMTKEDTDAVYEFVSSVDQVYTYNQALVDIINEETAPYFAGQKNAKEVAAIIQSRVQIYVNEGR